MSKATVKAVQKERSRVLKSETYDAATRCRAVLSVWTESRKPVEVCRELSIKWMTLMHWQKRAMEGMLQALTPRAPLTQGKALPTKLLAMLSHQEELLKARLLAPSRDRLTRRLRQVQEKTQTAESIAGPEKH